MNYRRLTELKEAKMHFKKYNKHIIFEMPNGAKICNNYQEVAEYYKNRCKEMKRG